MFLEPKHFDINVQFDLIPAEKEIRKRGKKSKEYLGD